MVIKVPELHYNHAVNILMNNLNLFGNNYGMITTRMVRDFKQGTFERSDRRYNKFNAALMYHKNTIE